jgi:DNA-binding XRE family transcriptional regulator
MSVGENVKELRQKLGWTQQELADKVVVSRPTITQIERGTMLPNILLSKDIAAALGVEISELLK